MITGLDPQCEHRSDLDIKLPFWHQHIKLDSQRLWRYRKPLKLDKKGEKAHNFNIKFPDGYNSASQLQFNLHYAKKVIRHVQNQSSAYFPVMSWPLGTV